MIWHCHWKAWELFQLLSRSWRKIVLANGRVITEGLDYAAVNGVMQIIQPKNPKRLFRQLRWLELGALAGINKTPLDEVIG